MLNIYYLYEDDYGSTFSAVPCVGWKLTERGAKRWVAKHPHLRKYLRMPLFGRKAW